MQFSPPYPDWKLDIDSGNTSGKPLWADLRPGRFCNLSCRMCFSGSSTKIAEEIAKHPKLIQITGDYGCDTEDWINDPDLFKNIQDWIPHLNSIKIAGGEPFFMPGVIKLLKWCIDTGNTHLGLDITTNGTRIKGKVARWLKEFEKVEIHVSIDGIGTLNNYIRHGSKWQDVDQSYHYYLSEKIIVNILSTVQIYNIHYLTDIIRYWKELGSNNHLIFNFVYAPHDLSIQLVPIQDRIQIADEIDMLIKELPDNIRAKCRFDALSIHLRQEATDIDIDRLRQRWIARTDALDELREEKLEDVNPKLFKLYTKWKKINQ